MATVVDPRHDENYQLTPKEAWAFFDATVRERLNISSEEFLRRKEEFKNNPHYESLLFLLPLTENVS
jgi:hypothetical protein